MFKSLLRASCCAALLIQVTSAVSADAWPSKVIRLVVRIPRAAALMSRLAWSRKASGRNSAGRLSSRTRAGRGPISERITGKVACRRVHAVDGHQYARTTRVVQKAFPTILCGTLFLCPRSRSSRTCWSSIRASRSASSRGIHQLRERGHAQVELWIRRQWLIAAPFRRIVQQHGWRKHGARSVQGRSPGDHSI